MIHKSFINTHEKALARVTFTLPDTIWADKIYLVGDFNDWNRTSYPSRRDRQGRWVLTVDLELGRAYQFRYLRNGQDWMNENKVDAYVHNSYGSDNFMVITDPGFEQYCDERRS